MAALVFDSAKREVRGWATTSDLDRANDTIEADGVTFNLPFPLLFNHDHAKPIGKVTHMTKIGDGWLATAEVMEPGSTTASDEAWGMVTQQAIKGFSVGFIPLEGAPNEHGGMHFKKIAVHELSVCAVPCNPKAEILGHSNAKAAATAQKKPITKTKPRPMLLLKISQYTPQQQIGAIQTHNEKARAHNLKHGLLDEYV